MGAATMVTWAEVATATWAALTMVEGTATALEEHSPSLR